jgi:hypothetical protein
MIDFRVIWDGSKTGMVEPPYQELSVSEVFTWLYPDLKRQRREQAGGKLSI